MMEPMTTRVEVWPVAADELGIWLISGDDAWRPDLPVMAERASLRRRTGAREPSRQGQHDTPALHIVAGRWSGRSAHLHGRDRGRRPSS